jgi:hypothetical protein
MRPVGPIGILYLDSLEVPTNFVILTRIALVEAVRTLHRRPGSRKERRREPRAQWYNWAKLFLGDINTGTWPSRLGESEMRQTRE